MHLLAPRADVGTAKLARMRRHNVRQKVALAWRAAEIIARKRQHFVGHLSTSAAGFLEIFDFLPKTWQRICSHKMDNASLPFLKVYISFNTNAEFWQQNYLHLVADILPPCFSYLC